MQGFCDQEPPCLPNASKLRLQVCWRHQGDDRTEGLGRDKKLWLLHAALTEVVAALNPKSLLELLWRLCKGLVKRSAWDLQLT